MQYLISPRANSCRLLGGFAKPFQNSLILSGDASISVSDPRDISLVPPGSHLLAYGGSIQRCHIFASPGYIFGTFCTGNPCHSLSFILFMCFILFSFLFCFWYGSRRVSRKFRHPGARFCQTARLEVLGISVSKLLELAAL